MKFAPFLMLALSSLPALAGENVWQRSYQLEAAGKHLEAAAVLEEIGEGDDASFILSRKGYLAYLRGMYNESASFYRRSLERNPKSMDARLGMTLPLLAQQRWKEAALFARQVIAESAWNYTAHVRLLVAEEGQREWRAMAEHSARLVERYPSDATAWVYLARAHAWLGEVREARNAYSRVLDRYPGHLEATRYLANSP